MDVVPVFKEDVDGIPVLWCPPDPSTDQGTLVIWLAGFGGTKESCAPQLRDLAAHGFTALSFDAWQHGERRIESEEELRTRVPQQHPPLVLAHPVPHGSGRGRGPGLE